ncbi:RNA-guided endonuclease InsQ/TnpB family protein [Streptomyces sp. NPDC020192]|uniref:RNA-guided endonuclease InsQ/TnpB family protein n=1 Tax=Streptomyces sp. NPDC020192 TaxID=3365066 RepID=UPI0037B8BCF4
MIRTQLRYGFRLYPTPGLCSTMRCGPGRTPAWRAGFASLKGERKGPRLGAPRLKSRKDRRQSIRFTANARWCITPGVRLNLPKIGEDAAGRYFVGFVIGTDAAADLERMPDVEASVGIDLGLTLPQTPSGGPPSRCCPAARKLARRRQKGSKNRAKARLKVARAHAKVADVRREFHHQLSTKLIRENQAVAVEDLAVVGLARTRLAKSVHDAGWSQFVGTCTTCGAVHDRDHDAAKNVKSAAGLAVTACGAPAGSEPVLARRGEAGSRGSPPDARAA